MVDVVVVGAGPFGLSIAAHLRAGGVPFRIFGKTMSMWQNHTPKGLTLKSDGFASNLASPQDDYPIEEFYREIGRTDYAHVGHRIRAETLAKYGQEFQRRYVGDVQDGNVTGIFKTTEGFDIHLNTGEEVRARKVVVATGLLSLRQVPEGLSSLSPSVLSHSSAHHDLSHFHGRRVIVIGGGQSACELSALLNEQGAQATLVTRRPLVWFNPAKEDDPNLRRGLWRRFRHPKFGLGEGWRTWFWSEMPYGFTYLPQSTRHARGYGMFPPAGSGWIKHRVEGVVPTFVGSIQRVVERTDEVCLSLKTIDGSVDLVADHVIAATGYRADVRRLPFLAGLHGDIQTVDGAPSLNRVFESSVSGLHFAGFLSAGTFGPSMRFIYGARFSARQIAQHLSRSRAGQRRADFVSIRPLVGAGVPN